MDVETILFALTLAIGFYMAWNIGANDVSNAIGTSVGSGALTLRRAVILAAIFEFAGAFLVGGHVSEMVQKGIVHPDLFINDPRQLVYGMMAALCAAGVWLQLASYFGWPVSTTHSIVGAVAGFGLVYGGVDAIQWENMSSIVLSWLVSPLLGAVSAYLIFTFITRFIFYSSHPVEAAKRWAPVMVFFVLFMLSQVILFKGLKNLHLDFNAMQAFSIASVIGLIGAAFIYFLVSRIVVDESDGLEDLPDPFLIMGLDQNRMGYQTVERIFAWMQMLSASTMAFAHGANDVANAIGPLSAVIVVLKTGSLQGQSTVPTWVLLLGGAGIVIGLATWGWRVIETIGKKITELTPSRGFAAEFAAATTILFASKLGLPISTTHTLVGAVLGVGLARGIGALNLNTIRDIFISWIVTVPAGALLSIGFFYLFRMIFS
ncbi:Putative phosphate permease CPn_0680/CP_0067/CPj0680/CpB0707 [Chlamydiales bacterium SCGC AG-110-M15]|nr:Putative phosphate permease CPn_0680/CP_0067/CPj0680/CpB0707 [Chlamydiales bacterium SCGC AG-110-M15]